MAFWGRGKEQRKWGWQKEMKPNVLVLIFIRLCL